MSCTPGKVHVVGVSDEPSGRRFVLRFLQARDARLVNRVFYADYDPQASWVDHLNVHWPRESVVSELASRRMQASNDRQRRSLPTL